MARTLEHRTYQRSECVVFRKTNEHFGGLSNMAGGYPLRVNGVRILTSEALYQACRFPHMPDVQRLIIDQPSPMTAKMKSKPYRADSRPDWDRVRVAVMRWCLRVKLAQHWTKFGARLRETGETHDQLIGNLRCSGVAGIEWLLTVGTRTPHGRPPSGTLHADANPSHWKPVDSANGRITR